jgi:hypothetical protein
MEELFKDFFNASELETFKHVYPDVIDVEGLRKYGDVEVAEAEDGDFIVKTVTFTNFDKTVTFTREHKYYKYRISEERIKELKRLMLLAADEDTGEGYRRAAKIKKEIDALLITPLTVTQVEPTRS